jgi:hypothetical protein
MTILTSRSNFAPALTFFNNVPVVAFTAPFASGATTGQVTLIDPGNNKLTKVALIAPPGADHTPVPVMSSARPSITTFGQWLVFAWADADGVVNIAGTSDGINFGNSVDFTRDRAPCLPGTGPSIGTVVNRTTTFIELVVLWTDSDQNINYKIGSFPDTVPWSPRGRIAETSIDAPGMSSVPQNPNAAEVATAQTFFAWAGTDGLGTLTFSQVAVPGGPQAGGHVYNNNQNGGQDVSKVGPAVAAFPNGGPTTLAYTATSSQLISFSSLTPPPLPQLNSNAGSRVRKSYNENSFVSPAIAYAASGSLFWAWTGTDGTPGSLNFANDADLTFTIV